LPVIGPSHITRPKAVRLPQGFPHKSANHYRDGYDFPETYTFLENHINLFYIINGYVKHEKTRVFSTRVIPKALKNSFQKGIPFQKHRNCYIIVIRTQPRVLGGTYEKKDLYCEGYFG
jgi:hypothetical protein